MEAAASAEREEGRRGAARMTIIPGSSVAAGKQASCVRATWVRVTCHEAIIPMSCYGLCELLFYASHAAVVADAAGHAYTCLSEAPPRYLALSL